MRSSVKNFTAILALVPFLAVNAPSKPPWMFKPLVKNDISVSEINYVQSRFNKSKIPILMFHKIGWENDRYTLNPNEFRQMLSKLHTNNFYLINLEQYSSGNFSGIPTGKKPILLTFDDAGEGQFNFLGNSSSIDRNSSVGILEEFSSNYSNFGKGSVFFISYSDDKHNFRTPFLQDNRHEEKIQFLVNKGYDVGWHTPFHTNNTNATINDIKEQKMILDALIFKSVGETEFNSLIKAYAHPFGAIPKNREVFEYLTSQYDIVFDAWGGSSPHSLSEKFNKNRIPRIETSSNNFDKIINRTDNYEIDMIDSIYYEHKFNKNKIEYFTKENNQIKGIF